jgi:benzoate-CoA ligase
MGFESDNLAATLVDGALDRGWGERIALREGDRAWTYAQLADQIKRVATALRTLRIARGERFAVYMPDSLDGAAAILGAIYHGAIAVPISELGRPNDIRDILNDSGASAVVVDSQLRPTLDAIRTEVESLREVLVVGRCGPGERDFGSLVRGSAPAAGAAIVEPDATAVILYSAGARAGDDGDGGPRPLRGVPHSHLTPLSAFESFGREFLELGEDDRVFSVVRVSTAYGLGTGLLFPIAAGAEAMFLPEQPTSKNIFSVIETFEPTVLFATPSVYGQLARDAENHADAPQLERLRACVSGAEDMPPRVIERVRDQLRVDVIVGYGLTEAFQFVIAGPAGSGRPGCCGRPISGFEIRVIGDDGAMVGPDEIGTLEIRGKTVAGRYWNETDPVVSDDGWFTTRDRFMVDADGNYYHCGRVDHLFKVGGKWVSPMEVERALLANEAVWECAVIGADDEDGLIKPLAFVVPNIGHEPTPELSELLREYVKKELAPYKYPRWIEFLDELPKGPHGKILRYKLRERIKAGQSRRRAETATT